MLSCINKNNEPCFNTFIIVVKVSFPKTVFVRVNHSLRASGDIESFRTFI